MLPDPLDAVIFDMDGLLLDTETVWRQSMFDACAEMGFTATEAFHLSLVGNPRDVNARQFMAFFGADFPLSEFYGACDRRFTALCDQGVGLRPGAMELMLALQAAGVPRAVATSTGRDKAEKHLARAGLLDRLDALVTRDEVTLGKPYPETYLKAAEALGARAAFCLALEDSHNGVRAAHAAGMATVMVPDMLSATEEMRRLCVGVVDSLHDILRAIAAR